MDGLVEKYEFYLGFWGQAENLIAESIGMKELDFWFDSAEERENFKSKLKAIADARSQCIAFKDGEGFDVRKRTIAKMIMAFPNGKKYPFEYDFGYAYEPESAEYMFFDGNYSCDCNKSNFLSDKYPEITEMECGDEIVLEDFKVVLEV